MENAGEGLKLRRHLVIVDPFSIDHMLALPL